MSQNYDKPIYIAAALFSGSQSLFNSIITKELEKLAYKTILPQRDGFEFANLGTHLKSLLDWEEVKSAVQSIIYFLDIGRFIPESEVILANLDEPQDEGVLIEISYARFMNKFVIGFRTDTRSPYGDLEDNLRGMHFFPAYQCNVFISHFIRAVTPESRADEIDSLIRKIDKTIKDNHDLSSIPADVRDTTVISRVLEGAQLLFDGVEDIHSDAGMQEISRRYKRHKMKLHTLGPEFK